MCTWVCSFLLCLVGNAVLTKTEFPYRDQLNFVSVFMEHEHLYISYHFQHTYSRADCTFREQILPDGYNIYVSDTHGALLSLGNHRQRLQGRDRGVPALAQFLPRISTLNQASGLALEVPDQPGQSTAQTEEPVDTMDLFGKLSQIIHSPSFHKR